MTDHAAWWCPDCRSAPTWPGWDPDTGRPIARRCNRCQQAHDDTEQATTHAPH